MMGRLSAAFEEVNKRVLQILVNTRKYNIELFQLRSTGKVELGWLNKQREKSLDCILVFVLKIVFVCIEHVVMYSYYTIRPHFKENMN